MSLEGKWYNKLGSMMDLHLEGSSVTGSYHTAVGEAQGSYPLTGFIDPRALNQSQAVGLVVAWVNESGSSHSVTTWSGQFQVIEGEEVLTTTWLLTHETEPTQDWKSTLIGTDIFSRYPPSKMEVEKAAKQATWSHPSRLKSISSHPYLD